LVLVVLLEQLAQSQVEMVTTAYFQQSHPPAAAVEVVQPITVEVVVQAELVAVAQLLALELQNKETRAVPVVRKLAAALLLAVVAVELGLLVLLVLVVLVVMVVQVLRHQLVVPL
jgi:hypothetical protein